jgi:hypothetical protein
VSLYLSRFFRLMDAVWHGLRRFSWLGRRFHNWHTVLHKTADSGILNKSTAAHPPMITYRELFDAMKEFTEEQLDSNVTIYDSGSGLPV